MATQGVRRTKKIFIEDSQKIYGKNIFDYSKVNYQDSYTEVILIGISFLDLSKSLIVISLTVKSNWDFLVR